MCSYCLPILPELNLSHREDLCPLRNSSYCSYCATYGHLMSFCKAKPPASVTYPVYLEQLIAPSDRIAFEIQSRTPLHGCASASVAAEERGVIEIKNNDAAITAYLAAHSLRVPRKSAKRQVLEEYASKLGKRIVYVS